MLESIALQASLAIDNARHHTEVEYQSKIDSLTGALNHGCFIKALEEEVRTATKLDKSLALIMMDIDHFKIYNDTWGHLVGDQVLTELTNVIKQHIKKPTWLADGVVKNLLLRYPMPIARRQQQLQKEFVIRCVR